MCVFVLNTYYNAQIIHSVPRQKAQIHAQIIPLILMDIL